MELKNKKINFLGDSITEGHGVTSPDKRFTDLIATREGAICRNYGIGGTRLARQQKPSVEPRRDLDFCSRVDSMEKDADIVVVFGGTNDYGHGDAPIGQPADTTPDTFYGALNYLYTKLYELYPESTKIIITPLHRFLDEKTNEDGVRETLKDYVEIIRERAECYSLPVLDLYATAGFTPAVPCIKEKYIPDGLHPNDAGHILLAERITAFIKSL
ncbi:MAG: SGNH/GDSL hydrolase family protein [Clostridiales bacterium]|nr:SGNH/GDSL hydrolase family protein [Clostridiales bacterium]